MKSKFKNNGLSKLINSLTGRMIWKRLVKKYDIDYSKYVILLPSENKKYNNCSMKFLPNFLESKKIKSALILTYDEEILNKTYDERIKVIYFSRKKAIQLMQFYCLYEFTDRLIIGSLEEPEGRLGSNLIGKRQLSFEEIFCVMIYGISNFDES